MRLVSFSFEDRERVGVIVGDEIVDLFLAEPRGSDGYVRLPRGRR